MMPIGVFLAGSLGAICRYVVDGYVQDRFDGSFPLGTFVVNVSGCLLLGVVTGLAIWHGASAPVKVVAGTGFVGAYTTFSTWMYETMALVRDGARLLAVANLLGSIACGMMAAGLGLWLAWGIGG